MATNSIFHDVAADDGESAERLVGALEEAERKADADAGDGASWLDLRCGDCLEMLKGIPDDSVDLVLTDPPYNIGVVTTVNGKQKSNEWDKVDGYVDWCIEWLLECQRVLKKTGVLYFWHNDIKQVAELLVAIRERTSLVLQSFCIWNKGDACRAQAWVCRDTRSKTALRSWFNICEYCLHFFNAPGEAGGAWI